MASKKQIKARLMRTYNQLRISLCEIKAKNEGEQFDFCTDSELSSLVVGIGKAYADIDKIVHQEE